MMSPNREPTSSDKSPNKQYPKYNNRMLGGYERRPMSTEINSKQEKKDDGVHLQKRCKG
ncbi:MAG: hypothetical protein UY48_C0021G0006 [Candidatus Gottesmanbacteria bacterium GW2011_GWB1_49_7]|uniref:Uncharacterized protein n=1 Tax=Candidatus Gottesmanbacteria bacterium GW2011_GWB1_49_7 TaxID=1618448 RepID=A0A0G1YY99_9BACT|nr:MAG: hypothetical protein UY48_C0021G0006 [Candidatus Gottesmanbacteria bacterium GW2011_GWB1_49_7]